MKLILRQSWDYFFLFYTILCSCIYNTCNEETISQTLINTSVETVEQVQGHHSVDPTKHLVQSSFEEQIDHMKDYTFADSIAQSAGISNGIYDTGQPIVTTFIDPSKGDVPLEVDIIIKETSQNQSTSTVYNNVDIESNDVKKSDQKTINSSIETSMGNNSSDEIQVKESETVQVYQDTEVPKEEPKQQNVSDEEIPSFSEWTQKQLEEAEKKESINTSAQSNGQWNNNNSNSNKVRSKNYASPDCGAKVISSNPEAGSPNNVLTPNTDEYILNTCTSRIWFVVELCEPIQAKKIEIGNFELFSSTPKEFTISVSDRYSSREWAVVGQFTSADERKLQAFDLQPHLFGRFIKFEMHSHYGAEHYCPISMLRVYGTTEFEVLEKETHSNPIDYEDIDDLDNEDEPAGRNLFSSATDAVIKMVNKAREVLGNKGNNSNQTTERDAPVDNYSPLVNSCTTPSHIVVCNNCSDLLFGCVYELLSCKSNLLGNLLKAPLIKNTIYNSDICNNYGIDFRTKRTGQVPNIVTSCVQAFFPPRYLAAFCNTAAIIENQVVLNISKHISNTNITNDLSSSLPLNESDDKGIQSDFIETAVAEEVSPTIELKQEAVETTLDLDVIDISYTSEIQPTKTFTQAEPIDTQQNMSTDYIIDEPKKSTNESTNNATIEQLPVEVNEEGVNKEEVNISSEVSDFDFVGHGDSSTPSPIPTVTTQGKESVFIKLSNRIKVLERNMSLSSQYLEELSRRYKKQVEEMQKMIDKTISALHEEGASKDLRIQKLEEKIDTLIDIVDLLATEKNQWLISSYWFLLVILVAFVLLTCCQRSQLNKYRKNAGVEEVQRRKSIGVVTHNQPKVRVRRPSEETALISGSYQHLLVDNVDFKKKLKDRKRKKKRNSITTMMPNGGVTKNSDDKHWARQESAPPEMRSSNWENQSSLHDAIQDIPFVLEESDHSPLEGLPLPKPLRDTNSQHAHVDLTAALDNLASLTYIHTATQSRSNRKFSPDKASVNHKFQETHRKSASVDETRRQKSPAPSTGNVSLNTNVDDSSDDKSIQKKSRRLLPFKKIFSRKSHDKKE